ncbi:hypothetical protein PLICRDRAFT_37313 [Plicaturopsis crispa FD-325 SS-3]|nr:hypothetical protein PLICRDRAFT_37313 [Plicaturopsis crispa FD-325 SS-3]
MDGRDDLPPEVIASIQRVLELPAAGGPEDPLDVLTNNFDPVDMLNAFFPDEASLGNIAAVQARLTQTEHDLQREIDSLQQELRRNQDPGRMQLIQEMISDLLGQMSRIREKATESEAVVRDITKDIQVLDLAKKNLILSMTTLRRLQMLANALTQLDDLITEKKYADIAQTLAAVKQLSASFKPYTSVHRISQVWTRIQQLQGTLRTHLDADFDAFYLQDSVKHSVIADACLVVDVLGPDVRAHFVDRYVALELKEYRRIFKPVDTNEAGGLDNIARRFAWFRRLLQSHEIERGRVFPSEWKVGWALCALFVEITRDDMAALLSKAGSALTVKVLLDTLQVTTEFETSMERKWATPLPDIIKASSSNPGHQPKTISSAWEPHMGVFVDAQDKALADMLAPHRGSKARSSRRSLETATNPDGADVADSPVVVLPSSTELFYFYGQSLEQCAKLSAGTGRALFDLGGVCKKWLKVYAEDVLVASMKRPTVSQPRRSMDTRFDANEIKHACLIINTADYCQTTASELEEKIRESVDEEYKDKVSLQSERDIFVSVISSAITVLLRELESATESAYAAMGRTTWSNLNQVSGQSAFIDDLVKGAESVADLIKPLIEQKKYLRNLFDKAASLTLTKFTNALVKSRPLKEAGAEQLLIDMQGIKACLLRLPGEALSTTSYTRGVDKNIARLEALLKVIVTPVDPPEGFILNYTLLIGDLSFSNFQKILDLKGTPKAEQNSLLDSFVTITSTKNELESTSFLSSLDMDPSATSHIGSPNASRVNLPISSGESMFAALGSPPLSGPSTGSSDRTVGAEGQKREVFSDFRRFVSFGLRRDTQPPA